MFTGIVRECGRIASRRGGPDGVRLEVEAPTTAATLRRGDSVAVNGCCLTATDVAGSRFSLDAVPETLSRTTLGGLEPGSEVNVEAALRAGEPLGGHYVQGHVDGVGRVRSLRAEGDGARLWIEVEPALLRYCVVKGSIAVDGVSLTIAALDDTAFAVALVPHTLEVTTLGSLVPGADVNVEVDVLAKYVERLMPRPGGSRGVAGRRPRRSAPGGSGRRPGA